eukprot:gene17752-biopygen22718
MWLPLGNTFHRNETLDAILTGGKYTPVATTLHPPSGSGINRPCHFE